MGADFMSGRLLFGELTKGFSKERRDRIVAIKAELVAELLFKEPPLQQERRLSGE